MLLCNLQVYGIPLQTPNSRILWQKKVQTFVFPFSWKKARKLGTGVWNEDFAITSAYWSQRIPGQIFGCTHVSWTTLKISSKLGLPMYRWPFQQTHFIFNGPRLQAIDVICTRYWSFDGAGSQVKGMSPCNNENKIMNETKKCPVMAQNNYHAAARRLLKI